MRAAGLPSSSSTFRFGIAICKQSLPARPGLRPLNASKHRLTLQASVTEDVITFSKNDEARSFCEADQMELSRHMGAKSRLARFGTECLLVLLLSLVALPGHSQDAPQSPAPTQSPTYAPPKSGDPSKDASENKKDKDKDREAADEVPKRIFWIIPNFMTANDQPENRGPLTTEQKYGIAWHQFADQSAHFGNVFQAAISQAANGIPHYGEGWGAFGERFLAQEGDQFTGSFLIYGVLPEFLHQDPRYFRKGVGSPLSRVGYAVSRVVTARSDDGRPMFNASQVFGQLGQAGISLTYYPRQDRDVRGLFVGWAVNQGYNIGWNQLKEFTPDLSAYLKRRSQRKRAKKLQNAHSDGPSGANAPTPDDAKN